MLLILIHQKGRGLKGRGLKRLVRHSTHHVFVKFGAGSREQGARDGVRLAAEIRCDVGHSPDPARVGHLLSVAGRLWQHHFWCAVWLFARKPV